MIRTKLIGFVGAVALLAVTACDSDDDKDNGVEDSSVLPGDAGGGDASVKADASVKVDAGGEDAGIDAAIEEDAGIDAAVELDATVDAASVPDAAVDAAVDAAIDAAIDAAVDAATPDAAVDAALPALAAHYTFNENTGAVADDTAGAFADAVLLNGVTWTAGKQGSAIDLAGAPANQAGQYVTLPANILDGCDDITIALWMRLGSVTNWSRLLDLDGFVDGFLFFTPAQDVSGAPHLFFNIFHPPGAGADDQGVSAAYPSGTVLVNTWHHVAFTLTGGTGRLYFDGVQIGSNPMTTTPGMLGLGAGARAWIGRSSFPDPYLDATLDDLRISCTAYSAAQVAALAD